MYARPVRGSIAPRATSSTSAPAASAAPDFTGKTLNIVTGGTGGVYIIYGAGLVLLFGVSATYHIFKWPPAVRAWLRRADHATIFVFIAATYTPLVFNILDGWVRVAILIAIWTMAAVGAGGAAPFLRIPRRALTVMYVSMGWLAVVALAPLTATLGWIAAVLMAAGGVQYSIGAAFYATKRPRLWPRVFGYHELFHVAVITASITFYAVVFAYAVPFHRPD